jgi:hypothetical protein
VHPSPAGLELGVRADAGGITIAPGIESEPHSVRLRALLKSQFALGFRFGFDWVRFDFDYLELEGEQASKPSRSAKTDPDRVSDTWLQQPVPWRRR